jgi:hypothetical protein
MLIIFTFQIIQTIRIIWFCHRSVPLSEYLDYNSDVLLFGHEPEPIDATSLDLNMRHYTIRLNPDA